MAGITTEELRREVSRQLVGIDLSTFTIGKLRGSVEQSLGLTPGALEERKTELIELVKAELAAQDETPAEAPPKKQRVEPGEAKEKKAKKEKKERSKKEKKQKKDKTEAVEAQLEPEPAEPEALEAEMESEEDEPMEDAAASSSQPVVAEVEDEEGLEAEAPLEPVKPAEPAAPAAPKRAGLLSASEDGGIRYWDNGRCVHVLDGHKGAVYALVVNWDTMEAVSGGEDSSKLWSLQFGGCIRTMSDTPEGCLSAAADWEAGRAIVGCGDGTIRVWSLKTAELLQKFLGHRGGVWALQGNFQENYLASGGDEAVKIWNTKDWTCLYTTPGHAGGLLCISVNWSGLQILGGSGSTSNLQLWHFDGANFPDSKPVPGAPVGAMQFHGHQDVVPDLAVDWSKSVAVTAGWDANLIVWNLKKGTVTHTHECKFGRVRSLAVDFANSQVWCGSSNGNLHLMDMRSGLIQKTLEGHGGAITAVIVDKN